MRHYFYKYIFRIILAVIILAAASCSQESQDDYGRSRTVFVYINADNNLAGYAYENINQLLKGYAGVKSNSSNLIVYADYKDKTPELYEIVQDNGRVVKRLIKTYGEQDSSSEEVMGQVFGEVYDKYPASSYGLILAYHGAGWLPEENNTFITNKSRRTGYPTRSKAQSKKAYLDIKVLSAVLDRAPYQDFIIFDACLMGSAEVAYELKGKANYIIASPTEVHAKGFAYDKLIKSLFVPGKPDYQKICDEYVAYYRDSYKDDPPFQTATISVVNLKYIDAFRQFVKRMISKYPNEYRSVNALRVQPFDRMTHKVFFDARDLICQMPLTRNEIKELDGILEELVPGKRATAHFVNLPIEKFSGISLGYEPYLMRDLQPCYEALNWNKKTE